MSHALTMEIPAALETLAAAARPVPAEAVAALELEVELSDDDLEQVAGGLARVWTEAPRP